MESAVPDSAGGGDENGNNKDNNDNDGTAAALITSGYADDDAQHPANLICELCRGFYRLGWVCINISLKEYQKIIIYFLKEDSVVLMASRVKSVLYCVLSVERLRVCYFTSAMLQYAFIFKFSLLYSNIRSFCSNGKMKKCCTCNCI